METVSTSLDPFSAGYQYTEFRCIRYAGERVLMSSHRDEDLRAWRKGAYAPDLPVVLRMDGEDGSRHVVPKNDSTVSYEALLIPDHWPLEFSGPGGALVTSEAHTRQFIGDADGT